MRKDHALTITQGTKGGRNKSQNHRCGDRSEQSVPVNNGLLDALSQAVKIQSDSRNLIPPDKTYIQWRDHAYYQWRSVTKNTAINGFHDMRAAYACQRYQIITEFAAPVMAGERLELEKIEKGK